MRLTVLAGVLARWQPYTETLRRRQEEYERRVAELEEHKRVQVPRRCYPPGCPVRPAARHPLHALHGPGARHNEIARARSPRARLERGGKRMRQSPRNQPRQC